MSHEMVFILRVSFVFLDGERISIHIEDLQILEFGFFISSSTKIRNDLFKTLDLIVADWEYVEFAAFIKSCEDHDFVIVKREVSQID
jgi:hypothetical protein